MTIVEWAVCSFVVLGWSYVVVEALAGMIIDYKARRRENLQSGTASTPLDE